MLFFSQTAVNFIQSWILLHIGTRININILSDFLIKLMKLPIAFFDSKMIGDLLQRVYDHERIKTFLTTSTLITLFSFFNLIVFGIVLLIYNGYIFLSFVSCRKMMPDPDFYHQCINRSLEEHLNAAHALSRPRSKPKGKAKPAAKAKPKAKTKTGTI